MADATGNININAPSISKLSDDFAELAKSVKQTQRTVDNVESSFNHLEKTLTDITKSAFKDTLISYNKSLYEMSRQAAVTGQSYNSLKQGMDNLSKSTSFSTQESTKFYRQVIDGTRGLKMSAGAVNDLAKTLQMEYGPALEDVTQALGDLMEVQNKDVEIFERMRRGMSTKEVVSLAQSYQDLGIITNKQAESLIRTSEAMNNQGRELSEQEKKLRSAHDAQQRLNKSWADVKLNWAEKLNDLLPKIDSILSGIVSTLNSMPKGILEKLFTVTMVGGAFVGGRALVGKAAGLLGGTGGGVTDKVKSLITGTPSSGGGTGVVDVRIVDSIVRKPLAVKDVNPNETARDNAKAQQAVAGAGPKWYNNAGVRVGAGIAGAALLTGGSMLADKYMETDWKTGEKKHTQASAGISAASNIMGSAATGFAIAGPWGAAAGAAVGLVTSFDQLNIALKGTSMEFKGFSEMMSYSKTNAEKIEKETGRRASEPGMDRKAVGFAQESIAKYSPLFWAANAIRNKVTGEHQTSEENVAEYGKQQVEFQQGQEIYGDLIEKKYKGQGKTYESMSESKDPSEWAALDQLKGQMRDAHKIEKATGVNMKDDNFAEAAMKYDLAQQAARASGIKGEKNIDSAAQSLVNGKASTTSDLYLKYAEKQKNDKARDIAESRVQSSVGDIVDEKQMMDARKNIGDGAQDINMKRLGYQQAVGQFELIKTLLDSSISSTDKLAENALRFGNNQGMAAKYIMQNVQSYGDEITKLDDIIGKQKDLMGNQEAAAAARRQDTEYFKKMIDDEYKAAVKAEMARTGVNENEAKRKVKDKDDSPDAIKSKMDQQLATETALLQNQSKRSELVAKEADERNKLLEIASKEKALIDSKMNLLQSEMDLSKAMYLGLGPTLDAQLKMVDLAEQKLDAIEREIAAGKRSGEQDMEYQKRLTDKQTEKNQLVLKELEITKNLREGYMEAMSAFTNVSGSFSKIILKREMGAAQMMRDFMGPGGLKSGALGAGAKGPMAHWEAGGHLDMASSEMFNKEIRKYTDEFMPDRRHVNTAAANKDLLDTGAIQFGKTGSGGVLPSTGPNSGSVAGNYTNTDMAASVSKGIDDSHLAHFIMDNWGIVTKGTGGTVATSTGTVAKGAEEKKEAKKEEEKKANDIVKKLIGGESIGKTQTERDANVSKALAEIGVRKNGATGDDLKRLSVEEAVLVHYQEPQRAEATLKKDSERKGGVTGKATGYSMLRGGDNGKKFGDWQQAQMDKNLGNYEGEIGGLNAKISHQEELIKAHAGNEMITAPAEKELAALKKAENVAITRQLGVAKLKDTIRPNAAANRDGGGKAFADMTADEKYAAYERYYSGNEKSLKGSIKGDKDLIKDKDPQVAARARGDLARDEKSLKDIEKKHIAAKIDHTKESVAQYKEAINGAKDSYVNTGSSTDKSNYVKLNDTLKKLEKTLNDQLQTQKKLLDTSTLQSSSIDKIASKTDGSDGSNSALTQRPFSQNTDLNGVVSDWLMAPGFADGGEIGGSGSGDTVPAMLTPGEFVINTKASKKYAKLLTVLNGNKFAMGGVVGGASGGGGANLSFGGQPNIYINVKGDTVDKIMAATMHQLEHTVNRMVTPHGQTSRFFDKGRS